MRGPIIEGLTEKQAGRVSDYVFMHTRFLPDRPVRREHADGSESFSLRIPGAPHGVHDALKDWISDYHEGDVRLEPTDRAL